MLRGAARRVLRHAPQVPAHGQRDHLDLAARGSGAVPARRSATPTARAAGRRRSSTRSATTSIPRRRASRRIATHPTLPSLDQGDYVRLMQVLTTAFGGTAQPVPGSGSDRRRPPPAPGKNAQPALERPVTIWYLEDGFETVVPSDKRVALHGQGAEPAADPAGRAEGALGARRARPGEPAEGRGRARLLPAGGRRVLQLPVHRRGRPRRLAVRPALGRRHAEAVVRARQGACSRRSLRATVDCSRFPVAATGPRRRPTTTPTTTTPTPTTTTPTTTTRRPQRR